MEERERIEFADNIACMLDGKALDHVTGLIRDNADLYETVGILMGDERMRVRLGTTAVLEELQGTEPEKTRAAAPFIRPLLRHEQPLVRGDAANLLALVSGKDCREELEALRDDPHPQVRAVIEDILEDLAEG